MTATFTPLFFNGRNGPLYGVHHAPDAQGDRSHGVLFLPPLGQDYKRCHKSLEKLARDLATSGFHVLRFDYGGSGDSARLERWSLDSWREDARDALQQLQSLSGAGALSAFGVRLGAAVAVQLGAPLSNLILWDPVGNGAGYLEELEVLNLALLHRFRHSSRRRGRIEIPAEQLVGHRFPNAMRSSLQSYALEAPESALARRSLWIDVEKTPGSADYAVLGEKLAGESHQLSVEARCHWRSLEEIGNVIMGQPIARQVLLFLKDEGGHGNRA